MLATYVNLLGLDFKFVALPVTKFHVNIERFLLDIRSEVLVIIPQIACGEKKKFSCGLYHSFIEVFNTKTGFLSLQIE